MFKGSYHGKTRHAGQFYIAQFKAREELGLTHLLPPSLHSLGDLPSVLARARAAGVQTCILTGGSLSESKEALELAEKYGQSPLCLLKTEGEARPLVVPVRFAGLYSTVGLHPTRSNEMEDDPAGYLSALDALIAHGKKGGKGKGRIVAVGECGLGPSSVGPILSFSLPRSHTSRFPRFRL
jgi:Tat protein secretion system quality control protein TatD with DNase activity